MTRVLYLNCFSGIAGDMLLGALLDAGLPAAELRAALAGLNLPHQLRISRVMRAGVAATKATVIDDATGRVADEAGASGPGHHAHDEGSHHHDQEAHHHLEAGSRPGSGRHQHRGLAEIRRLIDAAALSTTVRARAVGLFERLAEAEAAVHNVHVDQVHFHEVGAVDSIVDIVGCVWGLEWFGIDEVVASPINVGSGSVRIAHGTFPVPAPATVRLLMGAEVYAEGPAMELTTPTGALLATSYAGRFGACPAMRIERVGYGAGAKDLPDRPNVTAVVIGTREEGSRPAAPAAGGLIVKLECEIDDMSPQLVGPASDAVFAAGALDVFTVPAFMKKQRPGLLLTVLAPLDRREAVVDALFRETTTIGVRYTVMARDILERRLVSVSTSFGPVRVKVAGRGGQIFNAVPEFEDCAAVARRARQPIKVVHAAAMRAWLEASLPTGPASAPRTGRRALPRRASRPSRTVRRGRSGPRGKK